LPPNIARRRAIDLIWIKLPGETVGYPGGSAASRSTAVTIGTLAVESIHGDSSRDYAARAWFLQLCFARCGCVATVENGRFTRLDPDPTYPTGRALCGKGHAADELVYSKNRLTRPLRRTRPKGDDDFNRLHYFQR
jgi:anaerobic selenocysteine-containing dehydrogenase